MKKILAVFLLSPLAYLNANLLDDSLKDEIIANMNCKVTGQTLIESIDGEAKTYSQYQDGLRTGDSFIIKFHYMEFSPPIYGDRYLLGVSGLNNYLFQLTNFLDSNSVAPPTFTKGIQYGDGTKRSNISDDFIALFGTSADLSARRYYKNDWHLMIRNLANIGSTSHTLTANCMNMPKAWEDIVKKIKSFEKNKWNSD